MSIRIGQRFDVLEFTYDNQRYINKDIIKTGWQAIGEYDNRPIRMLGIDGKFHTAWRDEVKLIGCLKITAIK